MKRAAIIAVLLAASFSFAQIARDPSAGAGTPSPTTGTGDWVRATSPTLSGTVTLSSGATMVLPLTTFASQGGILYKGATPWIHDFNYGNNGTVTTGGYNVFLGGAGNFTMGVTATNAVHASENIGIGSAALYSNTIGYRNVVVGSSAMPFNTTGNYSVAVGYNALNANTTGVQNTAVGSFAMALNTQGSINVAVGDYALREFNPASSIGSNTVVGHNTGRGITTGTQNTIIGAQVGAITYLPSTLTSNIIIASGGGGTPGAGELEGVVRARAVPEFTLVDNTATTFAVLTLGNDTGGGGSFDYCVYAQDATTGGIECGRVDFAGIDVTAGAGGEVCPTPTKVGTPLQALSGSTLAVTFAATTGTDLCNIRVTADTDIATPVALNIKWWAVNSGRTLTPQ